MKAASSSAGKRRQRSDPEYAELRGSAPSFADVDADETASSSVKRRRSSGNGSSSAGDEDARASASGAMRSLADTLGADMMPQGSTGEHVPSEKHRQLALRNSKLTDLEQHVRELERENLHLKQALLMGKKRSAVLVSRDLQREKTEQILAQRTQVVTEMVDLLNSSCLSLGDAARVWHQDCRIGVGIRDWDAFGHLQAIGLWNVIRSVFATIAVDIVELRPHLSDGEMILTKWRIQGEVASPAQLDRVCASEDCPPTMRIALKAIKSSDLTFTVTTYVIFQDAQIAEQHHCWDQVGVFKRLFGGEIPASVQAILAIDADEGDDEEEQ